MRKLALALALVAGCGGSDGSNPPANTGPLVDPGPAPTNGLQIILPVHPGIQPGSDNELCTWTNITADHDLYIKKLDGFQTITGHHAIVYQTTSYQPPGTTRTCTGDDLTTVRYVSTAALGEGKTENTAPGNLAYVVQKGYQIVVNEHFLNASPDVHDGQTAMNLYYADTSSGQPIIPSGGLAIVDTDLHLQPGMPTVDIDCTMSDTFKAWLAFPHMHAYGVDITVDYVPATGAASQRLFDTNWNPSYTFQPPQLTYDPAQPMMFNKGDHVKVHCLWNNNTAQPLTFGTEMCVFFAATVDDTGQGSQACDAGDWSSF